METNLLETEGAAIRFVPLTQGLFAVVDADDWPELVRYQWCVKPHGRTTYAIRRVGKPHGKQTTIAMHRHLLGNPPDEIDHRNGDGLDNRRSNLRLASHCENMRNSRKRSGYTTSQFKGVGYRKKERCWTARITVDGRRITLGYYRTEESAAEAYANAAQKHYGEFAKLEAA